MAVKKTTVKSSPSSSTQPHNSGGRNVIRRNRNRRGRRNRNNNNNNINVYGDKKRQQQQPPREKEVEKLNFEKIDNIANRVILFDEDEFYGLTVDLVLFNLKMPSSLKVHNKLDYQEFTRLLDQGSIAKSIYLIDEYFLNADNREILHKIKEKDKEAKVILYTLSDEDGDEIESKSEFDHIVFKTGKSHERTLIQTLSEIFGVEFVADNSDPELE